MLWINRWGRERRTLEALSSLSSRSGDLKAYLQEVAVGVSRLIGLDWSVVTLCQNEEERILASSVPLGEDDPCYSLHGTLTDTVFRTGQSLAVEDAKTCRDYGEPPEGYQAYLGVPLRTAQGEVIGTICSFHRRTRRFTTADLQIVELFAERASTVIDNYQLYQQEREFNEALEQALEEAKARLIERERWAAVGEFCAKIVHEIRNPLSTISLTLNAFSRLSGELTDLTQERLTLAKDEVERLERLLNELLVYSKLQVMQPDDLEPLELNEELEHIYRCLQEEDPGVNRHPIQFRPASHPIKIRGDRDRLKQVFLNLIRNAREAVEPTQPIHWWVESDEEHRQVQIQIHNGGEPIPPERLSRVTELFFTTKSSGTGLGLAIVKQIVITHGGTFDIQSGPEVGTTVSVRLPWMY